MGGVRSPSLVAGSTVWLVLLLFAPRFVTAQALNVTEPTEVISGEDLNSMGVDRLSDLLAQISHIRTLSVSGAATRFSMGGIASYNESAPALFIDGHPIDPGLFGSGELDLIGLPVEVVDRVEVYARPSLLSGVFAGTGAIHIFTKQADGAAELHAGLSAGIDESEAGPLAFAGERVSEGGIEHIGMRAAAIGEVGSGSALASVVHRRYLHPQRHAGPERPATVTTAPSAVFTWANQHIHASVIGLGVAADWFPYLPHASRVLAADYGGGVVSGMLTHRIGERSFLRHRATLALSRAAHRLDASPWAESSLLLTSVLVRTFEERIVILGGTGEFRRAETGIQSHGVRSGSAFPAITGLMARGIQYRGGGMVALDGRSVAVKAYGGITFTRWERHRADVYVAVVDALPHEQNAADLWAREGPKPPLFPDDVERFDEDVAIRATVDAEWRWQPDASHEIRVGAGMRRSERIYLPTRTLHPIGGGGYTDSIELAYTSGTLGVFWGELITHVIPGRQRLFWNWQRTIVGADAYEETWGALPDARFGVSLATPMLAGFRMSGTVRHETGTQWPEYDGVSVIDADPGGRTLVDVFISRRLWVGRLHGSIGVWNVLGDDRVDHPLGDRLRRSIRFDIRLDLSGGR